MTKKRKLDIPKFINNQVKPWRWYIEDPAIKEEKKNFDNQKKLALHSKR